MPASVGGRCNSGLVLPLPDVSSLQCLPAVTDSAVLQAGGAEFTHKAHSPWDQTTALCCMPVLLPAHQVLQAFVADVRSTWPA